MKIKVAFLSLAAMCFAGSLMAQEIDDMYFNSKDRAKLNAAKAEREAKATEEYASARKAKAQEADAADEAINPTDSYSARTTNPEFVSRENSEVAQSDNEDYFVTDYRNTTVNNLNQFNNNYSRWSNSSWYNNNYYGSSMNGWNSPYYYNSYANPWMSPYYQPGWYGSMSYYWGSPYYGNSYYGGYADPFYNPYGYGYGYNPYCGYNSFYGSSFGWGWGGGFGSYYYWGGRPTVVIVNNNGGDGSRGPVYGKRADRGGMMTSYNHQGTTSRNRQSAATRAYTPSSGSSSNGRVATTSTNTNRGTQAEYYNRSWRTAARQYPNANTNYNNNSGNTNTGRSSNWGSNNNNSSNWNSNNTFRNSNNTYTPAPSRSYDGGGTRTHSSSPGGGSGGRTRGRD